MGYRQEARDRFDRFMRVPDRAIEWVAFASCGLSLLMAIDVLTGQPAKADDAYLLIGASVGGIAVYVLYLAIRFVAAFVIAARAVRRQRHASGGAGLHEDSPADQQNAHPLAVGM